MLPEISLNILDIVQNSISAKASLINIVVESNRTEQLLKVRISDNGRGMTEEQIASVTDPFFTTRTTRSVGLGIPFFKQAAECTGGDFSIVSRLGEGTTVEAAFHTDHIDCMPLGDVNATIHSLVTMNSSIDFLYERYLDDRSFVLDTRQMREILGDIPFDVPDVSIFLKNYLEENETEIMNVDSKVVAELEEPK